MTFIPPTYQQGEAFANIYAASVSAVSTDDFLPLQSPGQHFAPPGVLPQSSPTRFVAQTGLGLHLGHYRLSASPPALTWTAVPLCSAVIAAVNLTNLSPSVVTIHSLSTNNLQFRPLTAVPLDLPPHGLVSVSIQYTPAEPRPAFGQLRVRRDVSASGRPITYGPPLLTCCRHALSGHF